LSKNEHFIKSTIIIKIKYFMKAPLRYLKF
jgi:hypothetical protein